MTRMVCLTVMFQQKGCCKDYGPGPTKNVTTQSGESESRLFPADRLLPA